MLLNNKGVLPRDYLLQAVWGNQGLSGSYNNLNQYISILRRAFRRLALDDIILSLPRMGGQLNPSIHILEIPDENDAPHMMVTDHSKDGALERGALHTLEPFPALRSGEKNERLRASFYYFIPGVILLLLSVLIAFYLIYSCRKLPLPVMTQLPVPVCHVNALENVQEQWRSSLAEDFIRVKEGLALPCDEHHQFFFHYTSRLKSSGLGNTLLTQCISRSGHPDGYCENYFFYNWR